MCVTAIVLSMGTKFVNKEEIVSGTRSEDSVTLRLSTLRVFIMIMYSNLYFNVFGFFIRNNKKFDLSVNKILFMHCWLPSNSVFSVGC